ncbi:serine/threonine-protein kinase PLK4 isoform X2 [Perognathus longimembris pacificus]|uniref:serine/threonine-protein kinase PLK4 isoform X2 n=1 Tax=Perognathus longimembris pacificus TaxID=214514 RepID=UPI00201A09E1|nr:serine/threonine-protein kinase PLK4 isoform X2 [Perognathus longimembris pacificus]
MATCIGEKIEDFKVGNLLGKGSFAGVYRAESIQTGLEVAIKMIDKKAMYKAGMVQRVQNEVKIHCQLKHPSILELYNYFEDNNYVYLVLEMCHNGEMNRYLKNRMKPFSENEARHFMHQIITGMLYLHSHGILHRDLTLSNLLLTRNMNIKIADFGLATQLKMPHEKHYTLCGTPNYISPEIATRSAHGLESDVWSLGCMFYTLLIGRPPFDTDTVKNTLNKVVMADYEMPTFLSKEAKDLIHHLLRRNPADRLSLSSVLDHPFMSQSSSAKSKDLGTVEDSIDSGHATISTAITASSGTSVSGSLFDRRRLLIGHPLPNKMAIFPKSKHSSDFSSGDGSSFCNQWGNEEQEISNSGRRRVIHDAEERPHSRYLRRAHSSDRSSTSSQSRAKTYMMERCHSAEVLSKSKRSGIDENERYSQPSGGVNVFHFFKEKTSSTSGSLERPDNNQAVSNHLCLGKTPFPLDQTSQMEMVQQWFGNLQVNAHLRETTEHGSISPHQDHQGYPDWQDTSRNAWTCENTCENAHPVKQLNTMKYMTALHSKPEIIQQEPIFGLDTPEQSKTRGMESTLGCQKRTLRSITAPLIAHRLKPIRQKTKKAVVSILDSEEVCVELLKECTSEEYVKEVLQISSDGTMVTVYYPNDGKDFPLIDRPPSPTDNISRYSFDNLPEKYWRKYQYASRFVQLVRSKTPKITYFTRYAKCILMENSPGADFEVWFYDGTKIHKTEDSIQVIEKTGRSYSLKNGDEANTLKEEINIYMDHANEGHHICLALESIISEEEKKSRSACFFPIIVGRKPGSTSSPKALSPPPVDANYSMRDRPTLNKLIVNRATSPTQGPILNPSIVTVERPGHKATPSETSISSNSLKDCLPKSAQLLKSVFVKNVGWATQLTSGAVWVQFNDGSQLVVQAGVSSISYTSPNGLTTRYGENEKLPEYITQKLHCLSSILLMFSNPSPSFH